MKNRKHMFALGGSALLALAGVVHAEAPATDSALKSEMATLKARIGELEGKQSQQWLDARRTEEVKALVREVLSDADTRASLQADGLTAGHANDKFFLASHDGTFRLNISGVIQVRYIFNQRNDPGDTGLGNAGRITADPNEGGFSIARAKLIFDGYIGSPKINYKIQLAADRMSNGIFAEVVTVGYKVNDCFSVSAGRFKDAFLGESIIDDHKQLAVERSTVDAFFGNGYVEGIQTVWVPVDAIKVTTAFHDGAGSGGVAAPGNTNDFFADATNFGATARIDWKAMGDWKQQNDFSSWNDGTALFVGVAATYQESETGDDQTSAVVDDYVAVTVDALFKTAGLSVYGAFVDSQARINNGLNGLTAGPGGSDAGNQTWENMGAVLQVGYFVIPDKFEPYARYEWLNLDSDGGAAGAVSIVTVGANYYLKKHAAKFSLDLVWCPQSIGGNTGAGLLGDAFSAVSTTPRGINEDQIAIRAQFQLLF